MTQDKQLISAARTVCADLRLPADDEINLVINGQRVQRSLLDVIAAGLQAEALRLATSLGLR